MPAQTEKKVQGAVRAIGDSIRVAPIKLDSNGNVPTRIPLFVTGDWPHSIKGNFSVNLDDLKELKDHFDAGIGFPTEDASTGLAIDFRHDYDDLAAGWIRGLVLDSDDAAGTGTLYADPVEWTDAGTRALLSGEFKCISPMGSFGEKDGKKSMWQSVTDLTHKLSNVLEGAGLTNIPFLQGMAPIRAAAKPDENVDELDMAGMIFVSDKDNNKENTMTLSLDEVRIKDKEKLSAEEQTFLEENKDRLKPEELTKFGLEVAKVDETEKLSADDKELLAAIRDGKKKVVDADQQIVTEDMLTKLAKVDGLEKVADDYRNEKASQLVLSHVERGAIKPDQQENWTKMLLAADEAGRATLEKNLEALPSNELLAAEVGHDNDVEVKDAKLEDELKAKTEEHLSAAKADGKVMTYGQAQTEMLAANKDLLDRVEAERNKQGN